MKKTGFKKTIFIFYSYYIFCGHLSIAVTVNIVRLTKNSSTSLSIYLSTGFCMRLAVYLFNKTIYL